MEASVNLDWTYLAPLLVVVALTVTTGVSTMMRTAIVIFVAYWVNTFFVLRAEIYDPWLFFIISDSVAAWAVLHQPAGRIQSVIGGLLITQIVVDLLYGVSKFFNPETVSADAYLDLLYALGILQLILLGGWAGGHWIAVAYRALRRWRARRSHPARPHGVA